MSLDSATTAVLTTPPSKEEQPERARVGLREYGLIAALVVITLLFQILTGGRLLLPGNLNNLVQQNAYVLVLAMGMLMVIVAGHIDLSVGSVVAVVGAIAALGMTQWNLPVALAVALAIAVGGAIGAWQGFWVAYVGIPAFIVTLAGMLLFRGITWVLLTGGTISGLPDSYVTIGSGWLPPVLGAVGGGFDLFTLVIGAVAAAGLAVQQIRARRRLAALGLPRLSPAVFALRVGLYAALILWLSYMLSAYQGAPIVLIVLAALLLIYSFVMGRTVFGRQVYAIGGNRFAARMSGVRTRTVDFLIFVNMGVLAGVAGVLASARSGSAVASAGTNYELDAIAAVFIGGAAVNGGVGKVTGAVIGGLVMGVLNMGLSILSVATPWQQAIKGLVLLLAVAFDLLNKRRAAQS